MRFVPAVGVLFWVSFVGISMTYRWARAEVSRKDVVHLKSSDQCRVGSYPYYFAKSSIRGGSHFILYNDDGYVSYFDFVSKLRESSEMRKLLTSTLQSVDYPGYFWESIPTTSHRAPETPYEFVLLSTSSFNGLDPEVHAFASHFDACTSGSLVTNFPNLGHDAMLVTPCPTPELTSHCGHLADFIRSANDETLDAFWKRVGEQVLHRMEENDSAFWLSTSGLGVIWLHVRIDDYPKYYNYSPYKREGRK